MGPDGEDGWHTYRIEWHTTNASLLYYVDNQLMHNSTKDPLLNGPSGTTMSTGDAYIPFLGSHFTISAWFPYGNNAFNLSQPIHWAGEL